MVQASEPGSTLFSQKYSFHIGICQPFQGSNMTVAHGHQYKREDQVAHIFTKVSISHRNLVYHFRAAT